MLKSTKHRGNISTTIIIFALALIFFSICAIDAGYIILTRYKTQKTTETTALYMASYIKSIPTAQRNPIALDNIKERIQNLYSNKKLTGYNSFKITNIELKNVDTNPKIKITTETYTPVLFLRFFGLGITKILQTSYAIAEEWQMPLYAYDTNSYTFKSNNIITDKTGNDIKINYDNNYLIFAGLEDYDGKINWADISTKTDNKKTKVTVTNGTTSYEAYCINEAASTFDLSKDTEKTIGLVEYIKIYKVESSNESEEPPEGCKDMANLPYDTDKIHETKDTEDIESEGNEPIVTILNSVRLIKKSEF